MGTQVSYTKKSVLILIFLFNPHPGIKDGAFLFKGNKSSYIEIQNNGNLDTKFSITILANIFPTGKSNIEVN